MRIPHRFPLLLALTATLSIPATVATAQSFDADLTAKNQALAVSPRSLEAYPWLAHRTSPPSGISASQRSTPGLALVKRNRALSSSPRMLEQFPQLALQETVSRTTPKTSDSPAMLQNPAIAASPRIIEQFPALSRPSIAAPVTPAYEVAPLK